MCRVGIVYKGICAPVSGGAAAAPPPLGCWPLGLFHRLLIVAFKLSVDIERSLKYVVYIDG